MGRVARCMLVVVLWSLVLVPTAVAETPFERPANAARELVSKRTIDSRTWEMPSGQHVTQIASGPVQWQDARGAWHDLDLGLRSGADGWSAAGGDVAIKLPARLDESPGGSVRVTDGQGNSLSMVLLGDPAAGAVDGDVATYRGVLDGVDVRLQAVAGGLKEDVILRGPDASRDLVYRLTLGGDDLVIQENGEGGLRVMLGGERVFRIPAPTLVDAKGAAGPHGSFEIRKIADRSWEVSTRLDEAWLGAKDRAWPVVVDPSVLTFNAPATDDCQRWMWFDTGNHGDGPFYSCNTGTTRNVGTTAPLFPGFVENEWMLRFNTLTLVQTDAIDSATLKVERLSSTTSSPQQFGMHRIKSTWSAGSPPTGQWMDLAPYGVTEPVAANGQVTADVSNLVVQWRRYSQTSGASGLPNHGIYITGYGAAPAGGGEEGDPPTNCNTMPCTNTVFASAQYGTVSQRPVLEVKSWPAAPAGSAVISPEEGQLTGKRVKLQAKALHSSVSSVRFQYIAGSQKTWTDIPLAALKTPTRGSVSSLDIPVTGPTGDRRSNLVIWDLTAMTGGDVDGPVHVRAWLESGVAGQNGMTDEVNFRLDRRGIDGSASADVGPGEVNLLSGEFSMSQQDATFENFLQDLTLTRTYRSRGVAVRNADMFGSGWAASVEADGGDLPYKGIYNYSEVKDVVVDRQILDPSAWNWELFFETFDVEDLDADIETMQDTESFNVEYAVVEASDGTKMTFTQVGGSGPWEADDLHPGYTLTRATTGTAGIFEFTLTDPSGNVAKFRSEAENSPNYRLSTFKQPGSPGSLSYTYEASGLRQRLKSVTGPVPTGGTSRSLVFTWSNVGSSFVPRVTGVAVQDGTSTPVTVATYSYDADARLTQVTDPRIAGSVRKTIYHYNAGGQLDQITLGGDATWNLGYSTIAGDAGPRLSTISRAHPDGGTATTSVRYGVALEGTGAAYNMSTTETAKWGQVDDLPWDAVAIFPQDTLPVGTPPTNYNKATIHYIGLQGRAVNIARPGGAISTFEHDGNGNVIRTLGARNREQALAAGASSASVAQDLSTLFQYSGDGVDLVATREPKTEIKLANGTTVTGRRLSTIHYDEGAPSGGPFHLPTSRWRAVEPAGGGQVDVKETVRLNYDAVGTSMSGWTARQPIKTIVDPAGKALTSYSILHPTYPVVEETRTPGGAAGGNTPDVQFYQYYKIAPSARVPAGIVSSQCSTGTANGSGRLCMRSEGTTPTASVARRWYTYTLYGHVATLNESKTLSQSGTSFRSTTHTYNGADELITEAISGGGGTATPTITHTYAAASGRETQTSSSTATITRVFDSNGRLSQYSESSGNVNTYHYDLRGRRISAAESGTGTTTYGYDDRDNLISLADPDVGAAITAGYNADDELVAEVLPNDLMLTQSYDETGRPLELEWEKTDDCSSNCVYIRSEVTSRDADGNITGLLTNKTQETLAYNTAGRLISSDAKRLSDNRCVRRTFTYDGGGTGDSNRTSSSIWTSSPGAACGSGSPTTRALTYDTADRISSSGWVWDEFGRATSVPATDSGVTGVLTAGYYSNDMMRQLVLDGRTHTYTRDPLQRAKVLTSSGASKPTITSTYHYADDSDEPSAISRSDGSITRDIEGPSGLVIASDVSTGDIIYELRDIQGNIVATGLPDDPPSGSTEYDPFGTVTTATPNVIDWTPGLPDNGWLGAHQRATNFGQTAVGAAGPIEMGARVYLPKVGRFLQPDPIDGGSANAYDYAMQDPVNKSDLDGRCVWGLWCPTSAVKWVLKKFPVACLVWRSVIVGYKHQTYRNMTGGTRFRTVPIRQVVAIPATCFEYAWVKP